MPVERAARLRRGMVLVGIATVASLAPATVPRVNAADVSYEIVIDTGDTAQVGETITLTPVVAGLSEGEARRCVMSIVSGDFANYVFMQVASDDCAPWALTVPPSPLGSYTVGGFVSTNPDLAPTIAPDQALEIGAGTAQPFVSNYPVKSWAAQDLLSDPTPAYGAPVTVEPPTGLDGCRLSVFAGTESLATYQYAECLPWTFTAPAPAPDAVTSMFSQRTDAWIVGWVGTSTWSQTNPELPFIGSRYGSTYNAAISTFSGTGGSAYASDRPAIFTGPARSNVYYFDDPTTRHFAPVVIGATAGSCTSDRQPLTRPVVEGACGTFDLPPPSSGAPTVDTYRLELRDDGGQLIAQASSDVGFVDHMAPVDVGAADVTPSDAPVIVDASTTSGTPETYRVTFAPVALAAGSTMVPTSTTTSITYTGSFTPQPGASGDSVTVAAAGLAPGTWDVKARFIDVIGTSTPTTTRRITVVASDTAAPTVTAPRRGFAPATAITGSAIALRVPWSGDDTGSGIARYDLAQQTDGGAWATVARTVSPSSTRWLSTEHTYRFRVRATDKAGNTSAWVYGDTFRVSRYSENNSRVTFGGTWSTVKGPGFWGGAAKRSTTAGSTASLTFTGRSVAWVASTGPDRGAAAVYVNGSKVATVDLYSPTAGSQRLAWVGSWTTSASRTITIKVLGTSGRPRVDFDAFVTAN